MVSGRWISSRRWVIAGLMTRGPIQSWAPYAAGGLVLVCAVLATARNIRKHARQLVLREKREAYLPTALAKLQATASPRPDIAARELSPRDLAHMRFFIDRGLQPIDSFNGFTIIDQFQPAALRYSLNFMQYALAIQQCQYTPSFHGYLSKAQRNLIAKFQDKRVWGYWIWEKLLGHFSLHFDPIGRDNIMLGGFLNLNINLYQANTGDRCYDQPGAFQFRLNVRKTYQHSAHTINAAAVHNFKASVLALYPCEPCLAYTYCNLLGLAGVPAYDRAHGQKHFTDIRNHFRKHLDEDACYPDFTFATGICNLTGTEVRLTEGVYTEMAYAWLANAHFPDVAQRSWAIVRTESLSLQQDGRIKIQTKGAADNLDLGAYRKSPTTLLAITAIGAREMGDDAMAEAAMAELDRVGNPTLEDGILRYEVSSYTQSHIAIARLLRRDDWRSTILNGPPASCLTGPLLTEASYPDVLVARAFSDGDDLQLVLYPGGTQRRQMLGLERLRPDTRYRVEGAVTEQIIADASGRANLSVDLEGRTPVNVLPA